MRKVEEKKTKPPARYNQATLIKDMTCIAKYVSDPEVKQLLISKDSDKQKENGSIGTPATRDQIVATLIARGYLEETGKGKSQHLVSTELGRSFYDILPDNMKCADVTAEWWQITENIKNGEASGDALFDRLLSQINAFLASPPPLHPINGMRAGTDEKVLGKCPVCSSDVVFGEHGAYCKGKCGMYLSGLLGKKLSEKEVTSLLKMKPTSVKGLKSQGGKTYDAVIIPTGTEPFHMLLKDGTEKNGYRFTFEFADKEPVGKCPKCQGNIMNGKYGLYCENKCGYIIPNFLYGKKITVKQYKELLSGNKVLLEGIKSKRSGKEFDAFVSFAGVESFAYIKDGTDVTAYRSKTNIEFR